MAQTIKPQKPILVAGGTGKTGRRVAEGLTACGRDVRIGSRSAAIPFDWADRSTWGAALDGASAAYISYYPDLAAPDAPEEIAVFIDMALARGLTRIALLSGRGEAEAQHSEDILKASGADWTILRCGWFNQNFSESFLLDAVKAGVVALPVGDVREPFVDADDIAEVAVAALTQDGHVGQLYELTGPRLLTFAEAVAEITAASGHNVRFEPISPAAFSARLASEGLPDEMIALLMMLFTEVLDGRNAYPCDGVQRALGRAPKDFRDYARAAARSGAWSTVAEPVLVAADR